MLEIKPISHSQFTCPSCGSHSVTVKDTVWPGIHTFADCACDTCQHEFYADYPVGHAMDQASVISKDNGRIRSATEGQSAQWLRDNLHYTLQHANEGEIKIDKQVNKECKEVVILNTLDYLYGHVLLKLLNAQHYLDNKPEVGLILIIPKIFQWLVPEGCAEVWTVNVGLGGMRQWLKGLDRFVHNELERFDKVHLSLAYCHPDMSKIDIERFTGVKPFDLTNFDDKKPVVTFVVREDRLWLRSGAHKWANRWLRRLRMQKSLGKYFVYDQNRLMKKTMARLRKQFADVQFYVVGMGGTGKFGYDVIDLRTDKINKETELEWCRTYAKSHMVVGVHGSNMLIPTAFAGGCVEILPKDRYGNIVQDVYVRYNDRRQVYLYRFVHEFASSTDVTDHLEAILKFYPEYYRYMIAYTPEQMEKANAAQL